jgi:hypothetical protein
MMVNNKKVKINSKSIVNNNNKKYKLKKLMNIVKLMKKPKNAIMYGGMKDVS